MRRACIVLSTCGLLACGGGVQSGDSHAFGTRDASRAVTMTVAALMLASTLCFESDQRGCVDVSDAGCVDAVGGAVLASDRRDLTILTGDQQKVWLAVVAAPAALSAFEGLPSRTPCALPSKQEPHRQIVVRGGATGSCVRMARDRTPCGRPPAGEPSLIREPLSKAPRD